MRNILVLLALVAATACSKPGPSNSAAPAAGATKPDAAAAAEPTPEPPKPVPAQLPDVLAKVNGESVNKTEFEAAVQALEQRAGREVPAEQRDQVYREVLDQLIGYKLVVQEAKTRNIDVPEKELADRLEMLKGHFGSPEGFAKALVEQKLTMEQFREQTRNEMRMAKMMEAEVEAKISVQPKDLTEFYEKNPDQFKQPERVRASHILIKVEAEADAKTKDAARNQAAKLLKQIRDGADFAEIAKKHSQDPGNAAQGGEIGFFTRGQMVGAFERAAFELKPGEVSPLVESPFGFHIIKVADKQAEKTLALDEVRPQLEDFLKQRQRQERTTAFVAALKSKGKVEVLI